MADELSCPRCNLPLSTFAPSTCKECGGSWASSAEVAGNTAPHTKSGAWTARGASKLECPTCTTAMQEVVHGPTNTIVDRCKAHGVWFDVNEMQRVRGTADVSLLKKLSVGEGFAASLGVLGEVLDA